MVEKGWIAFTHQHDNNKNDSKASNIHSAPAKCETNMTSLVYPDGTSACTYRSALIKSQDTVAYKLSSSNTMTRAAFIFTVSCIAALDNVKRMYRRHQSKTKMSRTPQSAMTSSVSFHILLQKQSAHTLFCACRNLAPHDGNI